MKSAALHFLAAALCAVFILTACDGHTTPPDTGIPDSSADTSTTADPVPPDCTEEPADSMEILTDDGSVTVTQIQLKADGYTFFYPTESSICDEVYLPMLLWDRTENGTENVRLTFCDLTTGQMTGWEYLLGNRTPGVFRQDGGDRLITGHDFDTGTEYGWRLSGPWTTPTVTELTPEEASAAYSLGDTESVSSPGGAWTARRKTTDLTGGGGLWIENADGEGKFIRENVMLSDDVGLGEVRGYYPIVFQSSRVLVYGIGGWEWPVGYGFYDTKTGECREIENGRGVLAVRDECVYTGATRSYSYTAIYKEYPDGREILLAERDTCGEELTPLLQYTEALTGLTYTSRACAFSYYENFGMGLDAADQAMIITVMNADLDTVRMQIRLPAAGLTAPEWMLYRDSLLLFFAR